MVNRIDYLKQYGVDVQHSPDGLGWYWYIGKRMYTSGGAKATAIKLAYDLLVMHNREQEDLDQWDGYDEY